MAIKKINPDDFRVRPGKAVDLAKWPTKGKPVYSSKEEYQKILREQTEQLSDLQNLLYATNGYALLLIFQAMDAAGKDSAIKHVMSGVNPQGCQVFSFKHPSTEELEHDFLWKATRLLPERGHIGIFNRSYYEEVLIVRVHREILSNEELPEELVDKKHFWRDRYRSIENLEDHLHRNGTHILKFFLHLSKGEQKKRFLKRIDDPEKNWKFSADDIKSTQNAPWYILPADDKENTGLIISRVILDALQALKMTYPKSTPEHQRELQAIRKQLTKES
jgi:PPK2 family polyphosphate:nucleotide phosphotransferase